MAHTTHERAMRSWMNLASSRRFLHRRMQRYGGMGIPLDPRMLEMKTCDGYEGSAESGGKKRLAITGGGSPRIPCFASKPSLGTSLLRGYSGTSARKCC